MTDEAFIGTKEERKARLGGSDFSVILGINPYKKRFEMIAEKAGIIAGTFEGNEFTKRGEELEDTVIKMFEEKTGFQVTDQQKVLYKEVIDSLPLCGHIDGFIKSENSLLEVKTTDIKSKSWADGIPRYYEAQMTFYCYLLGVTKAYIAVATCKDQEIIDFAYYEYHPTMTEEEILTACREFTKEVKEAKEKYGVVNNGLYVYNSYIDDDISKLEELKERISEIQKSIKPLEDEKKKIEAKLKDLIGVNAGLTTDLYEVSLGNRISAPRSEYEIGRAVIKIKYKGEEQ